MTKVKSARFLLSRRSRRLTPYASPIEQHLDPASIKEDWKDAVCPICISPPHNAVLLLCSSYEKGCRPYICDTSYRHSHCLSQFMKHAVSDEPTLPSISEPVDGISEFEGMLASGSVISDAVVTDLDPSEDEHNHQQVDSRVELNKVEAQKLSCPLCRGQVKGLVTVKQARKHLNRKTRSCAEESCAFVGDYQQLRKHARKDHPHARPRKMDPDREREWQRLEQESNIGDVLSTIRSAMPGALVFGDYVIENGGDDDDDSEFTSDEGNWWTFLLLIQHLNTHARITIRRTVRSQGHNRSATLASRGGDSANDSDSNSLRNISRSSVRAGSPEMTEEEFVRYESSVVSSRRRGRLRRIGQ